MGNIPSLEHLRALQKTERAKENYELWQAVIACHEAILALGGEGIPTEHLRRAQANVLRAGEAQSGDLPDTVLLEVATVGGSRAWEPSMGQVYINETVFMPDGTFYICRQPHTAQANWAPGTEGGRNLFRIIRSEPPVEDGEERTYLDFVWGELVPYGAVRRDPEDGNLYTPIKEAGVTLYEPHFPHLVPSEYTIFTPPASGGETGGEEPAAHPKWSEVADGYVFKVGTYFTDYAKTYHVLREFAKQSNWRPPALLNDFYEEVTA